MFSMHFGVLFIIGISTFAGILGSWVFQKMRIPQVMGYIVIGILAGSSVLNIITLPQVESLRPLTLFALGIIGFLVGGELHIDQFRKYGKQFTTIMFGEGMGGFLLAGTGIGIFVFFITHSYLLSVVTGLIFGAIASATDPASTINVLWEYRCRGPMTSTLTAVVALDDALALSLYAISKSIVELVMGADASLSHEMLNVFIELGGAVALGAALGYVLSYIIHRIHHQDNILAISIGTVLLTIGVAVTFNLDLIISTMMLGFTLANLAPKRSKNLFALFKSFSIPIYVLFFVLVGARLRITHMPAWLWGIVLLYVFGETVGKMAGTWIAAKLARAPESVRRYSGLGLFTQGGVAVGLSIVAADRLGTIMITDKLSLGELIVFIIPVTTMILQLIGPPAVKYAAVASKENGLNVTEEDLISSTSVGDIIKKSEAFINKKDNLNAIIPFFASNEYQIYPVVDDNGAAVGILSFEDLKEISADPQCWGWVTGADVMTPVRDSVKISLRLKDAIDKLQDIQADEILAVTDDKEPRPVGILEMHHIKKFVANEILRRNKPTQKSS